MYVIQILPYPLQAIVPCSAYTRDPGLTHECRFVVSSMLRLTCLVQIGAPKIHTSENDTWTAYDDD